MVTRPEEHFIPRLKQTMLLTAQNEYRNQGFAIIPALWSPEQLQPAIDALIAITNAARNSSEPSQGDDILWQSEVPTSQFQGIPTNRLSHAPNEAYIVGDLAGKSHVLKGWLLNHHCTELAALLLGGEVVCHFTNATIRAARVGCLNHWHRDWPNPYASTRTGHQLRIMICLDGMQIGQGVTRVIAGSHRWSNDEFEQWRQQKYGVATTGQALSCPPGSLVVLGPKVVHGAEANVSTTPRRNLIAQWGLASELVCLEALESATFEPLCINRPTPMPANPS